MTERTTTEQEDLSGIPSSAAELLSATPPLDPPSLLAYPATYLLIAINLLVFLAMSRASPQPGLLRPGEGWQGLHGLTTWTVALLTAPFPAAVLSAFGSCDPDKVLLAGQWWRLLTSIFVHVTLLHLLLNMWCLWNLGLFGERLLGAPGLVAVYLLTGVAGMLQSVVVSLWQQHLDVTVAGASGAVFGVAGILIVLLSNRKLAAPWEELRSLRRQVVFFAGVNLVLGALPAVMPLLFPGMFRMLHFDPANLPTIDNQAHLGGFVCGLALGVPLVPRMTSGRSSYRVRQGLVFGTAGLLLLLLSRTVASFAHGLMH